MANNDLNEWVELNGKDFNLVRTEDFLTLHLSMKDMSAVLARFDLESVTGRLEADSFAHGLANIATKIKKNLAQFKY